MMIRLKVGDPAPAINATDQDGNRIRLEDFKGFNIILYFYPRDNTPGCTAQACNLRDNEGFLLSKGFKIIGVSADSEQSHKNFISKYVLPFPLISDKEKKVIRDYGVWGKKRLYGKEYDGIFRTTFVISEKGIINQIITDVKTRDHAAQIELD